VARHDQIAAQELAAVAQQSTEQGRRSPERRIRDNAEPPTWQAQIADVALHDDDSSIVEATPQLGGTERMQLERDHACTGGDERSSDRPVSGADVEHEIAAFDRGAVDETLRPGISELVPPPARPRFGGHDEPSPWSCHNDGHEVRYVANEFRQ
jgi:hypothetical protein